MSLISMSNTKGLLRDEGVVLVESVSIELGKQLIMVFGLYHKKKFDFENQLFSCRAKIKHKILKVFE